MCFCNYTLRCNHCARVLTSTAAMDEDSLAAFADMALDDAADQGAGGLHELDDYGEYNNGFGDFSEWEGVLESRQRAFDGQAQVAEAVELMEEDGDHATAEFQTEIDPELRAEMLELLSVFQVVYENRSAIDTRSLLKRCVNMCERIMERYYRMPQVVAMHEQAGALLQMFENGSGPDQSCARSSNFATERCSASSGPRSGRNYLMADVKEALDRVDLDAKESDEFKDPDEGRVVNGVYRRKGIWYCQIHTEQEQCRQCGVDYRLLNQVHRSRTEVAKVDDIIRKEQERLEELERQHINYADSRVQAEGPSQAYIHQADSEDFESIARELNEELARARETDTVSSLKCFSPLFQIAEERKLVL